MNDFLLRLLQVLEEAQVEHMVVGSVASSHHGQPRSTQDLDVVVRLDGPGLKRLLERLPPDCYYVSPEAAHDALRRSSMFNVIDMATGHKGDLIVLKPRPFSLEEFQRRKLEPIQGRLVPMASAEDIILSKLEWAKESGSERQRRDILAILEIQQGKLDWGYLKFWAGELGVLTQLLELASMGPGSSALA